MSFKFNRIESFFNDGDSLGYIDVTTQNNDGFGFKGSFADLNLLADNKAKKKQQKMNKSNVIPKISTTSLPAGDNRGNISPTIKNPFGKKIVGDVFGSKQDADFMTGLMYRARNVVNSISSPTASKKKGISSSLKDDEHDDDEDHPTTLERKSSMSIAPVDDEVFKHPDTMNPKQQLAVTIRNWCMIPSNHDHVMREGGVHALVALTTIDDVLIRECCASAFYDLSSNRDNLRDLLAYGASSGVITLSMQQRSAKVSRLCAITLCNLAMQREGESIMAKDGALIALMVLLGSKGYKLLPICTQALYNLTCTAEHYKDIERVLKALINIPATGFDHHPYLVKALVNCARFSWIRLRMIEDGAVAALLMMTQSIPHRDNKLEFSYHILSCIRYLSESVGCRLELLVRGTMDIIQQILSYIKSEARNQRLAVKIIYNLLQCSRMNPAAFEACVHVITTLNHVSSDMMTLQYCAACMNVFVSNGFPISSAAIVKIIDSLSKLLDVHDVPVTQYYAIATTGHILSTYSEDTSRIENLILRLGNIGTIVQDKHSIQILAIIFARLTHDHHHVSVLEKHHMIDTLLELLIGILDKDDTTPALKDACGIAISRVSLKADLTRAHPHHHLSNDDDHTNDDAIIEIRRRIPMIIFDMLDSENVTVLTCAIGSARVLGQRGYYKDIFSSDTFYTKVAYIVTKYKKEELLLRMCCAVLAVFSYDSSAQTGLSDETIINVLFTISKSDDVLIKKLVATTLCNMSVNEDTCAKLVDRKVVDVIGNLSGATSEMIQELCAKCLCNLTYMIRLHSTIIKQDILQIILMISLVRSVGITTKRLCAISLLNLISDNNMASLCQAGVVRVFGTLSSINDPILRNICARGFVLFTTTPQRCEELIQRRSVVQSLYNMVKSKSSKSRVLVGLAVCNLLSAPPSQKQAILLGGLSVLKIICTLSYDDLKEATARVIISILQVSTLHVHLTSQPIASILTMMIQQTSGRTFDYALIALSCMSQYDIFRSILIEKGAVAVLVNAVMNGNITSSLSAEYCSRCLCFLSYTYDRIDMMIKHNHIIFGLHALRKTRHCQDISARMMAIIMRNLSFDHMMRKYIVHQDGVGFLWLIMRDYVAAQASTYISCLLTLYNLSLDTSLHQELIEQGFVDMIYQIVFQPSSLAASAPPIVAHHMDDDEGKKMMLLREDSIDDLDINNVKEFDMNSPSFALSSSYPIDHHQPSPNITLSTDDVSYLTKALELVSYTSSCCRALVDGHIISIINAIYDGLINTSRLSVAHMIVNISSISSCREDLVSLGTCDLLMRLSSYDDDLTQRQCSIALAYLSDIATIQKGVMQSILMLSLKPSSSSSSALAHKDKDMIAETIRDAIIKTNQQHPIDEHHDDHHDDTIQHDADMIQHQSSNIIFVKRIISEYHPNRPNASIVHMPIIINSNDKHDDDDHESIIISGALNRNYMMMEQSSLYGDYDHACYTIIPFNVPIESGGTADEFDIQFSMPTLSISSTSSASASGMMADRANDMMKVPIHSDALPKDYTMHSESSLSDGFANNFMLDATFNQDDHNKDDHDANEDDNNMSPSKGTSIYTISRLKSSVHKHHQQYLTSQSSSSNKSPTKKFSEPGSLLKLGSSSAKILKKHSFYRLGRSYSFAKENVNSTSAASVTGSSNMGASVNVTGNSMSHAGGHGTSVSLGSVVGDRSTSDSISSSHSNSMIDFDGESSIFSYMPDNVYSNSTHMIGNHTILPPVIEQPSYTPVASTGMKRGGSMNSSNGKVSSDFFTSKKN